VLAAQSREVGTRPKCPGLSSYHVLVLGLLFAGFLVVLGGEDARVVELLLLLPSSNCCFLMPFQVCWIWELSVGRPPGCFECLTACNWFLNISVRSAGLVCDRDRSRRNEATHGIHHPCVLLAREPSTSF
jgi:hypothetical protein